jgi:hypothetical protein
MPQDERPQLSQADVRKLAEAAVAELGEVERARLTMGPFIVEGEATVKEEHVVHD